MKAGLFLDDERFPRDVTWILYDTDIQWVIVRSYKGFCAAIQDGLYDVISLDHDLLVFWTDFNGKQHEETGYRAVLKLGDVMLEQQPDKLPEVIVHSQNVVGRENILQYWKNFSCFYQNTCL